MTRSAPALVLAGIALAPAAEADTASSHVSAGVLPSEPAWGPFDSLPSLCQALRRDGQGQCDTEPNAFARQWRRAARGPFASATTLRISRKAGVRSYASCHTALRTSAGWYIAAQAAPCEGPARGETRTTSLSKLTWADSLGLGVVSAVVEQTRSVQIERHRWWGDAHYTTDVFELLAQLCGMGADGVPRCTAFLSTHCGAGYEPLLWAAGAKLESSAESNEAERCSGVVLPKGLYALPFTPGWSAFHAAHFRDEGAARGAAGRAAPLYGPFASLDAYCADPPRFDAPLDPAPQSDGDVSQAEAGSAAGAAKLPDPTRSLSACERRPGSWNSRRLTASGPLSRVELLRMRDQIAGARFEQCRVAVSTAAGVFVSEDEPACQGVIGPGRQVSTRLLELAWLPGQSGNVFAITTERHADGERARSQRLCGVGPSGVPSCGESFPLHCRDLEGSLSEVEVVYGDARVTLRSKPSTSSADDSTVAWDVSCSDLASPEPLLFP